MSDNQNQTSFDVALSFAGEDRTHAEELATQLRAYGIKVFYDAFEEHQLWGENLYTYLADVYGKKAKFCVMFVSESYAKKLWTSHERQFAQERAFKENRPYMLPVRIDDTEIPGLLSTIGYVDLRKVSVEHLTNLLLKKLDIPLSAQGRSAFPTIMLDLEANLLHDDEELLVIAGEMRNNLAVNVEPAFILEVPALKEDEDELSDLGKKSSPSIEERRQMNQLKKELSNAARTMEEIRRCINVLLRAQFYPVTDDADLMLAIKRISNFYAHGPVIQNTFKFDVYRENEPGVVKINLNRQELASVVEQIHCPEEVILGGHKIYLLELPPALLRDNIFPSMVMHFVFWHSSKFTDDKIVEMINPSFWCMARA
ncbi:MAG TPA: TIR domain-containing protein [Pyrinomonadaceae bacterium]|nr:TIR domain-containing protein [Pyrinomonadaceae bacterium]